eukprot:s286_g4.t1
MLAALLEQREVSVAGLQETRCPSGQLHTGAYLRFCSGAHQGHFGCELWFRRGVDVVLGPGCKGQVRFNEGCFAVLHSAPRCLIVQFCSGGVRINFASIHSPHRATESDQLADWWHEHADILRKCALSNTLVICGDCNACIGSVTSAAVGSHDPEAQDAAGECWHRVLDLCDLWCPCTFSECHSGQSWTFVQKRNHHPTRADYVAIPRDWRGGLVHSRVVPEIHSAQLTFDHCAVMVDLEVFVTTRGPPSATRSKRIDASALALPCNRDRIEQILSQAPVVDWHVSSHAHAARLTSYLQDTLGQEFGCRQSLPRQPYITEGTWALHTQIAALRHASARLQNAVRLQRIWVAFNFWRTGQGSCPSEAERSPWMSDASRSGACMAYALSVVAGQLRRAVKDDRHHYLCSLTDKVQAGSLDRVFPALRDLLCHRKKKKWTPQVLPALAKADGTMCKTPEALVDRWREHFSQLEAGKAMEPEELLDCAFVPPSQSWPLPSSVDQLPTLDHVRGVLLQAKRSRAAGPDGIPPELGLLFADHMSRLLHPLVLKLALRGSEAIGFKAGLLARLYKNKGAHSDCKAHRGILLAPVLSKAVHQCLRPALSMHHEAVAPDMHLSSRKGQSAIFGSHAVRTFLRLGRHQRQATAAVFTDIESAYYASTRELAIRRVDQDVPDDVLEGLRLTAGDAAELRQRLAEPPSLPAEGADAWTCAVTAEVHHGTWMVVTGDSVPVWTRRGSRPGSAYADLVFAATVRRVLQSRDDARASHPHCPPIPSIPWDGRRSIEPLTDTISHELLRDVIWADDISKCIRVDACWKLGPAVTAEARLLSTAFNAHGYRLAYGATKTAALLCPAGPGSRSARRELFGAKASLPILHENSPASSLPLVDHYRHLGVIQAVGGSITLELRQRIGSAWSVFRECRGRVFKSGRLSIRRKGAILQSLVFPRLLYGAGAWPPLSRGDAHKFQATVLSMYRQLLGIRYDENQHLSLSVICALARQLPPGVLLHTERLRYLKGLMHHGSPILWSLLRQDESYMVALRDSASWLYAWTHAFAGLPHPCENWEPWGLCILQRPRRFRLLLDSARGLEGVRSACVGALCELHSSLQKTFGSRALSQDAPPPVACAHICLVCRIGFDSKVAWAGHAARKHGYRAISRLLATGRDCKACGKTFRTSNRLERHVRASRSCRLNWGGFVPCESPPADIHSQAMPEAVQGWFDPGLVRGITEDFAPALLRSLRELGDTTDECAWATVCEFVEPIQVIRETVRLWAEELLAQGHSDEPARNVLLLLDPEVICESFRTSRVPKAVPLQFEAMQAWVEQACDVVGQACLAVVMGPVRLNGCPLHTVKPDILRVKVYEPLLLLGKDRCSKVDIRLRVKGGGFTGQIYALRQAVAKGIVAYYQKYIDEASKKEIKDILMAYDRSLIVADPRRCEPKKSAQFAMAAVIHELVMSCDLQGIKAAIKDMQQDGIDVQEEVNSHEFGRRGARSPVHAAAVRGRAEILQYLLKVKADPNNADDAGTTSMHFAADLGHSRVAYHLLQAGGDPSRRNGFGSRPTDKLVNNSWDTPEVLQGKDQIRRLIAGEHLPYEALRPEPDAPAEDKTVVSPVTSPSRRHRGGGA